MGNSQLGLFLNSQWAGISLPPISLKSLELFKSIITQNGLTVLDGEWYDNMVI